MAKILIMTTQVNLVPNPSETPGLFGGHTLFLQLGCFGLDITSFCIASHKAGHQLALVLPFNLFFFLHCRNCGTKARSNFVYTFLSD